MAKKTVNIGGSANDGTGDQLRSAFDKLNQNNDEIYGNNFVTEDMLNDNIVGTDELKVADYGVAGQILTSDGDGTFSWATGVTGDITGVDAGDGLTGGGTGGDVTLTVGAGTGITVAADAVSLASTVQDEITLNTAKTGITTAQAADIVTNNGKATDQTVVLTEGANVTITGTYPSFTIASDDVVGAVNSVNGDTGVVVLDTADIAEDTNLYYTEARVTANTAVAANTAKTGISTAQASEITANNSKVTNFTHTGAVTGNEALTITDLAVTTGKIANEAVDATKLDVSNDGSAGQVLQYNADGTMTWVTGVTGDITSVVAGDGLTGGGTGGDVTLNVVGGAGITAAADEISLSTSVAGDGLTLSSGVLSVDAIQTGDIADDAVTSAKLALFDDSLAATDTHMLVANGTDFFNKAMSGDATLANTGAITIADDAIDTDKILNDAVTADKLADSINTDIATGVGKTSFPGFGTSSTTALVGDTALLQLGNSSTTALAGDTSLLALGTSGTTALAGNTTVITSTQAGHITANNDKVSNATHTGDVTGNVALTIATDAVVTDKILDANVTTAKIADDAVTADKLANSINTAIAANTAKDTFPGFGTTGGTSLEGDTALLALGTSGTTALAGNTALLALGTSGTTALAGNTALLALGTSGTTALAGNTTVITSTQAGHITANNDKVTNATHAGEVTGSGTLTIADGAVIAARLASNAVITAKIADDAVSHDKLENRFTQKVSVSGRSGATSIDWSAGAVFVMANSLNGNIEFDFTNFKTGQTIDIYNLTGAHTITFDSDASTSETFNKCGGVDYAGASTNLIQVQCVDDSAAAVFNYAVSAYVSDTTPS